MQTVRVARKMKEERALCSLASYINGQRDEIVFLLY